MEPALRPSVAAGMFCADDHQVDPRLVMGALCTAFAAAGGRLIEHCAVGQFDLEHGG
jgi:glycine oxidase